MYTPGDK